MHDLKSLLLICDAQVAEVTERDSQTVAEIVKVSYVGWFTSLWGKWCETRGVTSSYHSQKSLKAEPSPCCSFTHQCVCTGLLFHRQRQLRPHQRWWKSTDLGKKKARTAYFFSWLTSLLCGWPQMTVHREPNWVLPLSLKHDMLGL